MSDVIKEFLVSIGFAADESSARASEDRIKRVETTARKSDEARTRTAAEQAMERARQALKAEGIERATMAQIMAKRDQMAKAEADHAKKREQYDAKQAKSQAAAVAGMRTLVNVAAATAVAVQGVTIALAGYATHVAAKLEEMAYASDRTKSSVQDLKVFSQAVSQLGGSAGGALNDLENFAARLRSNPQGYTAFLKSVGVEARDAQGNIRGASDLYKEFRKNVGEKSYEQQLLYMQEMGVSEQTWRATDPAQLAAEEARSRAKYARMGYDPDKAKDDAKGLQHALRDMFESVNIIGEKTASKIFADVGDNLKSFTTFLEQHGDQIAEILSKVAQLVLAVSKALLELLTSDKVKGGLDWLMGMFGHVEEGSGKWVADTEKIKAALEALAVFVATVFVAKITGAFADILKELKPLLALLAPVFAALGIPILGTAAVGAALVGLGDPSKSVNGTGGRPDGQLNPGDELPGVGGGTPAPAGSEGAMARAKRLGRAALGAVGLGGGGAGMRARAMRASRGDQSGGVAANPGAYKDVLDHIARSEGTAHRPGGGYNTSLANGLLLPGGAEQDLKSKTLDEIDALQTHMLRNPANRWNSSAIGRYQVVRTTLRDQRAKLGLKGTDLYDEKTQDRIGANLARQRGADPQGLQDEWASLVGPKNATAVALMQKVDPKASVMPLPQSSSVPMLPKLQAAVRSFNEGTARLEIGKLRAIGSAAEGFDAAQYLKGAPPLGSSSTSNDNSVRNRTYNGGPTNVTINTHGPAQETAELWRRHGERQKADDVRYAASVLA